MELPNLSLCWSTTWLGHSIFILRAMFSPLFLPRGYKTVFMLNSAEHEIFFLLINVKMPTDVGILTYMSRKNSIISISEPEKS